MSNLKILSISLFFLLIVYVNSEPCNKDEPITTCDKCIWSGCEWCSDTGNGTDDMALGCVKKGTQRCVKMIKPKNPAPQITQDLGKVPGSVTFSESHVVQLSPQQAKILVIPNVEKIVPFSVTIADNPVDIYFVMDLTKTMRSAKEQLEKASSQIANEIKKLTPNYRLGFGSFSDKAMVPFAMEKSRYQDIGKPTPYSFQHHLDLTDDDARFTKLIKDLDKDDDMPSNVDSPESGLDAMAQAMLCTDIIGWRQERRKVIVLITDAEQHYAMDGILGGIMNNFDTNSCKTKKGQLPTTPGNFDIRNLYTEEQNFDYPSFGELRKIRRDKKTNIIFIVDKNTNVEWFDEFSRFIQDEKYVGEYDRCTAKYKQDTNSDCKIPQKPKEFGELVRDLYKDLRNTVVVKSNTDNPNIIEASLSAANCESQAEEDSTTDTQICKDVEIKKAIEFKAEIQVNEKFCLEKQNAKVNIELQEGFANDKLTLDVSCEDCKNQCRGDDLNVLNSPKCKGQGDLVCGGCHCKSGFSGKQCECDISEIGVSTFGEHTKKCMQNSGEICNNNGDCECGKCKCDSDHVGEFCACDKDECPKNKNGICGGHGECNQCTALGLKPSCTCKNGWTGDNCECPPPKISNKQCTDKKTNQICFGRGDCECGECTCSSGYDGKYCQNEKGKNICKKLEPCILSKFFSEDYAQDCIDNTHFGDSKIQLFGKKFSKACFGNLTIKGDFSGGNYSIVDDIQSDCPDKEELKKVPSTFEETERCLVKHGGCEIMVLHTLEDKYGSDKYFSNSASKDKIFVAFRSIEEDEKDIWKSTWRCENVPVLELIGGTAGLLLTIIIIGVICLIVVINLRDLREWKRYVAEREENIAALGDFENPLYQSNTTTTRNPNRKSFFGK